MIISFVIPTYNRITSTHRCVRTIFDQSIDDLPITYEIIISLDARDRGYEKHIHECKLCSEVIVTKAQQNGVNAARNAGVRKAAGEIICFLDDDCVLPDEKWIARLFDCINEHPKIKVVGGFYLSDDQTALMDRFRNCQANHFISLHITKDNRTTALLGGASTYRKEVFQQYGLFDETLRYGSAETEFNRRLANAGELMMCLDLLSVVHCPIKQSMRSYSIKSFFQGKGFAYVHQRYGREPMHTKQFSIMEILSQCADTTFTRLYALSFLFVSAIFFKLGYFWQRICLRSLINAD